MSDSRPDVGFSGSINTMVALSLVTGALSLALSVWCLARIGDLEAFVAVQAVKQAQQAKQGS